MALNRQEKSNYRVMYLASKKDSRICILCGGAGIRRIKTNTIKCYNCEAKGFIGDISFKPIISVGGSIGAQ